MDILKCLICIFCIITCFTRLSQANNPCQFFLENGQILQNSHEFHVKSTTEIGYTVVTVKVTNADYVDFTNVNDPKVVYYFDLIPEKIDAFNQNIHLKIRFPLTEIKEQYSSNRINGEFQCITIEGDITIRYFSILIDEDEKEPDSYPVFNANNYVYEILENYALSKDFTSSSIITVWTKRNSGLHFSFSSGNEDAKFGLKSVRWESSDVTFKYKINLYLKKSLDYEQKKHYTLKLQAVDISNSSFKTTVPLKIIVLDYDDMDPVFEHARYVTKVENFMLEQSAPVKLIVLPDPILAFDGDRGINAPLKYDIVNCSAFSSLFDIDEIKGTLSLLKPSNIKKIYQEWNVVIVRATQIDNASRFTHTYVKVELPYKRPE